MLAQCENVHYTFRTSKKKKDQLQEEEEKKEGKKKEWRQCIQILAAKDNPSSTISPFHDNFTRNLSQ